MGDTLSLHHEADLKVKHSNLTASADASNKHCVRAMNDDARTNVQKGQVGTIGALVLNPGSVNVCNEHEKCKLERLSFV